MNVTAIKPKKIAVIGAGISGLSCAWLLNRQHQVTLYEKDDRLGGHANTIGFDLQGQNIDVDTGFIVYNPVNYPNLVAFFDYLQVPNCETDMSFAVSVNQGQLEYSGSGLAGLFAQKRNLIRPAFWRMLKDLNHFYRHAGQIQQDAQTRQLSLRELLAELGYSDSFIYQHLLPMGAAIWSTPVELMLDYPAASFMRFCENHGLLQVKDRPQWRTVIGGSQAYVSRVAADLEDIRLNSRIHRIIRQPGGVIVEDLHGGQEQYDDVVLACHSNQALAMLDSPSSAEQNLLGNMPYQRNQAYLHLDTNLMPKRRAVWSSWNYLAEGEQHQQQVAVTYWMNQLQPLNTETPVLVSLNPPTAPAQSSIIHSQFYDHPVFNQQALESQQKLWQLQGQQNTWFCGAYFGYGFHEDGLQAGLAVAEQLGGSHRPWIVPDANSRIFTTAAKQAVREVLQHG
ncbi:NAD(P)/FAD-dependent oxidoreductase [Aliamphritea ceti]|uniref:NAD(P)/FAD-dependent oxidoreductase n=1 Tax=Aliamphritea ceti TaxID=1524258 RepID=UPI0021C3D426|nr:FAD-dependent oxidoreductase [Aliamphritea ceti]